METRLTERNFGRKKGEEIFKEHISSYFELLYRVSRKNRSISSNPHWQPMPSLEANYLLLQISDGHNIAIKLIESNSGHVSSELALPEANSDLAHKCISSKNPEAPGYHFLS